MDTAILIRDLTETEILSAIRERFEGERLTGINIEALIDQATTLGDLYDAISAALAQHEHLP